VSRTTSTVPPAAVKTDSAEVAERADVAELAATLERSLSWLRRALRPAEWSAVALSTLDAVDRLGPLRVTDLVARERITQPGMTGLLGRLEAADLVRRGSDPSDGRATLVQITPVGSDYVRALHRRRAAAVADLVARLRPDHRQSLLAAVDALQALVEQPFDDEGNRL
jgi:DNA-binding MarR family transcriptional regulator